ncbi:MAG: hypothetical protein HRU26_09055 [Psychroserpens sp.]|nr:hypothetical protein [Psychroserpens sp.]
MKKVLSYIKKLINSDSQESSKRVIALFCVLLVTYVVVRFTNVDNVVMILSTLLGFILALTGVSTWQSIKKK